MNLFLINISKKETQVFFDLHKLVFYCNQLIHTLNFSSNYIFSPFRLNLYLLDNLFNNCAATFISNLPKLYLTSSLYEILLLNILQLP